MASLPPLDLPEEPLQASENIPTTDENSKTSPVVKIHNHYKKAGKTKSPSDPTDYSNVELAKSDLRRFFGSMLAKSKCMDMSTKKPTTCCCLSDIAAKISGAEIDEAINYLYGFAIKSKTEQQGVLLEWMRHAISKKHEVSGRSLQKDKNNRPNNL